MISGSQNRRQVAITSKNTQYKLIAQSLVITLGITAAMLPMRGVITPNDHAGYVEFVQEAQTYNSIFGLNAKQFIGWVYLQIGKIMPYFVFTNMIFFSYLYYCSRKIKNVTECAIFTILTFPMFIYFNYITKESILLLIILLSIFAYHNDGKHAIKSRVLFFALISAFALFVRPYYAIPIAFSALTLSLGWKKSIIISLISALLVFIIKPVPFLLLEDIRQTMYFVNTYIHGARSMFPFIETSGEHVRIQSVQNWALVLSYIVTPAIWDPTLKGMYAQIHAIMLVIVCIQSMKYGDKQLSSFGIALLLVIPFFAPDLGTWIRHSSAASFFLFTSLVYARKNSRFAFSISKVRPFWN